ncbi:endonuclease domain-containing protein [Streptomyces sp. NPDC060031]|uniref:endonuclease domain-containing protein n=1 Tax=Streptomyces sp. NPDC060031 TaxID=3347043 RepID=UPI0036AA5B0C
MISLIMGVLCARERTAWRQPGAVGAVLSERWSTFPPMPDDEWWDRAEEFRECQECDDLFYPEPGARAGNRCQRCGPAARQASKYGLTIAQVNAILRVQRDSCAICGESPGDAGVEGPSYWQIDHDHNCCTGCQRCVRGLLCKPCNMRGVA